MVCVCDCATAVSELLNFFTQQHFVAITSMLRQNLVVTPLFLLHYMQKKLQFKKKKVKRCYGKKKVLATSELCFICM